MASEPKNITTHRLQTLENLVVRSSRANRLVLFISLLSVIGCGRLVFTPTPTTQPVVTLTPEQQQMLALQQQQSQERVVQLDRSNQELESLLAQSRQQTQILQDQLTATQDQLRGAANQLAAVQGDNQQLRNKTSALAASIQRQAGAEIRANNSLLRTLTITDLPGVQVRQDGDVIRIEIPDEQLFYAATPQLKPTSISLLKSVGADLLRNYPQQLIGIEGHTDNSPRTSPQYPTGHHLAIAQATAVYDALTRTLGTSPGQLFVIGHGSNPVSYTHLTLPTILLV